MVMSSYERGGHMQPFKNITGHQEAASSWMGFQSEKDRSPAALVLHAESLLS